MGVSSRLGLRAARTAVVAAIAAACSGSGSGSSAGSAAGGSGSAAGGSSSAAPALGSGSAGGSAAPLALTEGAAEGSADGAGGGASGGEPGEGGAAEPDEEGGAAAAQDDDRAPDAAAAPAVAVAADSLATFGYQVDEAAAKAGGAVRVIVRWPDTPYARRASPGDDECQRPRLPSVVPDELWGVGEVVVVLDVKRGKAPGPLAPVAVAAESCRLAPRLTVTRPGAALWLSNRDAAVRAAKLRRRPWKGAKKLEAAASASAPARPLRWPWQGHRVQVDLAEPGFVQVELEGKHAGEDAAWVAVAPSPYAALTDKAGAASFAQVPAGPVAVTAWIPARGGGKAVELSGKVTVVAGQTAELILTP